MTSQFYTSPGGETLRDIADKTGMDYDQLVKNNPIHKTGRIKKGTRIILSVAKVLDEKADQEEAKRQESQQKQQQAEQQKQQKKQEKKQDYTLALRRAEEDFHSNKASADADYQYKRQKLSQTLKKNRIGLESELAAQKIDASSIAENERSALAQTAAQEDAALARGYEEKIQKLKTKLSRAAADANRKISRL